MEKNVRKFKNDTCFKLKIVLSVRKDEEVGCTLRKEDFCLLPFEEKIVEFGDKCNPFLNGIHVQTIDCAECSETGLFTYKCHTVIDKLLNKNNVIRILIAARSLVVSGFCIK